MSKRKHLCGIGKDDWSFSDRIKDGVYVNEPRVSPNHFLTLHCDDSSPNGRILYVVGHTYISIKVSCHYHTSCEQGPSHIWEHGQIKTAPAKRVDSEDSGPRISLYIR
jgi:hypothetical protein